MKKHLVLITVAGFILTAASAVHAATSAYPLKVCIVTNDELGDDPVTANYKGRSILLCCKSCVRKFNANPEKYVAILDKELAKRKK